VIGLSAAARASRGYTPAGDVPVRDHDIGVAGTTPMSWSRGGRDAGVAAGGAGGT